MNATKKTNAPPITWRPLCYQSEHPMLLTIRPDASANDISNWLHARLGMLDAMTTLTYGAAAALDLADDAADYYLRACAELASECRALFSELSRVASFEAKVAQP